MEDPILRFVHFNYFFFSFLTFFLHLSSTLTENYNIPNPHKYFVWLKCPKETVNNIDSFLVYIGGVREPFCGVA